MIFKRWYVLTFTLLALVACQTGGSDGQGYVLAPVPAGSAEGFLRAEGVRAFAFPADHGPHPNYQTEWWYYTGNVETAAGRHFGYQLTFFRRGLVPPEERAERPSAWAADDVYMAHFTLTDVDGGRYRSFERFARGAAGLAGAEALPYRVWLEDWEVAESGPGVYRLRAAQDSLALDLRLEPRKEPVLHGEQGYSRKGTEAGNASYYYSQTRLATSGTVRVGETVFDVTGASWMDHEFSTSALDAGQVGWDWFGLQLDDGSELMVFHLRRADGSVDPFSGGTFVAPDGSARVLAEQDFSIEAGGTWRSARSGAEYPARWTVRVPEEELVLQVEPYLADQELQGSVVYWEGAVRVHGERAGVRVQGAGYVELTGYAGSMEGRF
jgi:predicted secreted hydrolase